MSSQFQHAQYFIHNLKVMRKQTFMQHPQVYVLEHRQKAISRQPICLTDADYDYILEGIDRRDKIEFEREIDVYDDDMED